MINIEKIRSKTITSDGEVMRNCSCGGRCCIFYDEDRQYRVECENCGTVITFKSSMDNAVGVWNRLGRWIYQVSSDMLEKRLKIQQENIKNLMQIIMDNPLLEIMPIVDIEIFGGDEHKWWEGGWGKARIDERYYGPEGDIYLKKDHETGMIEDEIIDISHDYGTVTDEKIREMAIKNIKNLPWEKVIVVPIGIPYP